MVRKGSLPFYSRGLQFECTRCGHCCTGFSGFVWLSETDIENISKFLGSDKVGFLKDYAKKVKFYGETRYSLIEKENYDCAFWDKLCIIYPVRPYQCKSYPYWKKYLVSEREWNKIQEFCSGVNGGRMYPKAEIEGFLKSVPNYDIREFKFRF